MNASFKKLLLIFFGVSLLIRLGFIFTQEHLPVMWDARIYSSSAVGLIYALREGGEFGHPENMPEADSLMQRALFIEESEKYIKGERISWLYYDEPTMPEAQDYLFLSGPVFPAFLAAVFMTNIGTDFEVIRVLNCIIDSFCVVLLMLIAHIWLGRKAAIISGLMYILYIPFVFQCGIITPDILTTFFLLFSAYCLVRWYDSPKSKYLYIIGTLLGILTLTKPTASLLFIPFLAAFLLDNRDGLVKALKSIGRTTIPFVIILLPWIIFCSDYFGQLSIRDPEYSSANFRSSSSIKYEGYDLDYTEPDFWTYPVSEYIKNDPLGYAELIILKLERLWGKAYNSFNKSFITTPGMIDVFHLLIVAVGLYGVFYCARRKSGRALIFFIPLYYTLVHVVFHSLARYNMNAMPFVIIAAGFGVVSIVDYAKDRVIGKKTTLTLKSALSVILIIMAWLLPVSIGAMLFGGSIGAMIAVILKAALFLAGVWILFGLVRKQYEDNASRWLFVIPSFILLLCMVVPSAKADSWAEWKARLDSPGKKAVTRIYISDDIRLVQGELVRIGFDISAMRDKPNKFYLSINGNTNMFTVGDESLTEFYYPKFSYRVFEKRLDLTKDDMRYWSFLSIDPAAFNILLDKDGFIQIELSAADALVAGKSHLDVYGNYHTTAGDHWYLPGTHYSSVERLVEKGDPRIWLDYKLSSDSAISYYINSLSRGDIDTDDLSPDMGKQTGRYRMIIEVKRLDKSRLYF